MKLKLSIKKRLRELKESQQRKLKLNNAKIIDAVKKRFNVDEIDENLRKVFKSFVIHELMYCNECEISDIVRSTIVKKPSISPFIRWNLFRTRKGTFFYNGVTEKVPTEHYYISVDDISNIYDIQRSKYGLLFSYSKLIIREMNKSEKYLSRDNSASTLSLLMENIAAILG